MRYTPVPEGIIGDAALEGATRRIQDVAAELALRSAATLHTFVQVPAFGHFLETIIHNNDAAVMPRHVGPALL